MQQAHVYISGFVQGVGFRAFVRSKARKLGINGWVRNLSDGRVEGVFQGEKDAVEKLIKMCRRGSFFSRTTDIVVDWEDADETHREFLKRETI